MVSGEAVTIGVLLGQVGPAYRALGGSSLVANILRTYLFGKSIRSLEVPDGDLITLRIYRSSMDNLKRRIAAVQPPPFPTAYVTEKEVKQVAVWTPPYFSEPVVSDTDVGNLADGAWLLWSKLDASEKPIPRKGVKIDALTELDSQKVQKPVEKERPTRPDQDQAIDLIHRRVQDRAKKDVLMDLAVDGDPGLLALVRQFGSREEMLPEWDRHVLRLLDRRIPKEDVRDPAAT